MTDTKAPPQPYLKEWDEQIVKLQREKSEETTAKMLWNQRAVKAEAENERLRAVLKGISEYCSADGQPLDAIERLVAVRNTALQALEQSVPLEGQPFLCRECEDRPAMKNGLCQSCNAIR